MPYTVRKQTFKNPPQRVYVSEGECPAGNPASARATVQLGQGKKGPVWTLIRIEADPPGLGVGTAIMEALVADADAVRALLLVDPTPDGSASAEPAEVEPEDLDAFLAGLPEDGADAEIGRLVKYYERFGFALPSAEASQMRRPGGRRRPKRPKPLRNGGPMLCPMSALAQIFPEM